MNVDLERAKIAVEEYKVLHAELLQRNNLLNQMLGACIAVIGSLIGLIVVGTMRWQAGVSVMAGFVLALIVTWKLVDNDARHASKRICEIEKYVNGAVGGDDQNPLSWERRFGILVRGYMDRAVGKSPQALPDQNDTTDP
jgi:hypothetical protein